MMAVKKTTKKPATKATKQVAKRKSATKKPAARRAATKKTARGKIAVKSAAKTSAGAGTRRPVSKQAELKVALRECGARLDALLQGYDHTAADPYWVGHYTDTFGNALDKGNHWDDAHKRRSVFTKVVELANSAIRQADDVPTRTITEGMAIAASKEIDCLATPGQITIREIWCSAAAVTTDVSKPLKTSKR